MAYMAGHGGHIVRCRAMPPKAKKRKQPYGKQYEQEYGTCSCEELRQKLLELGEDPGPIDASNKDMYVRLLVKKRLKLDSGEVTPSHSSSFSSPINISSMVPATPPSLSRPPLRQSPSSLPQSLTGTPVRGAAGTGKKTPSKPAGTLARQSKALSETEVSRFSVNGLIAATFTPFTSTGDLHLPVIGSYADWLCQNGVNGVFVNGTTGESLSLTVEERKRVLEAWLKESAGRLTVIAHVGCESIRDTCELAQHAERSGADAVGVMPTTFFKPSSIDHLIQYLSVVAVAAPNLPLFYYHIPSMTGVNFNMEEFLDAASSRLPTLRGIKYSSTDLHQLSRCVVHSGGRYSMLYGCDQQLLGALVLGCTAAIGSTYNYMGKLNNRMLAAVRRNDMESARQEQRRSQAVITLLEKYGGHAGVGKVFMHLCGLELGPPRLPLLPLPSDKVKALETSLHDIGFTWT